MSIGSSNDGKVVPIKDRPASQTASGKPMGELLSRVRGIAMTRLEAATRSVFDNLDDVLFDLAEKASSNSVQVEYFDGMRELRKSRPLIERRFLSYLDENFVNFSRGTPVAPEQAPATREGTTNLSLVGELELEESLAIAGMIAKAEGRLARPLFAINQRLAIINGGAELESRDSPLGPTMVGHAFRRAMLDVPVPVQIKLITYKLFERYAVTALEKLYDDVNADLIRSGVLPHAAPSRPAKPEQDSANGVVEAPSEPHNRRKGDGERQSHGELNRRESVEISSELFQTLRSLLAERHAPLTEQDAAIRNDVAATDTRELVQLLSSLQHQITPGFDSSTWRTTDVTEAARLVRQVKQSLIDQVSRQRAGARSRKVSAADEDTIDLVGMLFEFILSDRNLPSQFQAILGRLQIPYLKVAVLDKHLFAHASHPARRLLDTLARAGLSWSEEGDPNHRLLDKAGMVVERILKEFVDDVDIFDSERADFEHFLELHRKRSDVAEQRVGETARGKEKLSVARRIAASEMLRRIDGRQLPPIIHDILCRPWANYLVLTHLRHGEDSLEWRNALRFADELIWSALPKKSTSDAERLELLLPQLETALRQGLTMIGSHDDDTHRTLDELSNFYAAVLAGVPVSMTSMREALDAHATPAAGAKVLSGVAAIDLPQSSPVEEVIFERDHSGESTSADASDPLAEDDPYLQQARNLRSGAWFEFKLEHDDFERAKLSWISPFTSNLLFVNRRGLKVAERSLDRLARELRDGLAIPLEQAPLFDRAMDAVVGRLRAGKAARADDAPPDGSGSAVIDA